MRCAKFHPPCPSFCLGKSHSEGRLSCAQAALSLATPPPLWILHTLSPAQGSGASHATCSVPQLLESCTKKMMDCYPSLRKLIIPEPILEPKGVCGPLLRIYTFKPLPSLFKLSQLPKRETWEGNSPKEQVHTCKTVIAQFFGGIHRFPAHRGGG